jgi:two-component system sensor histidine kinase DesK
MGHSGAETADARLRAEPRRWTQGWRRLGLAAGLLIYPIVTASGVSQYSRGAAAAAGYGIVAAFMCVLAALPLLAMVSNASLEPAPTVPTWTISGPLFWFLIVIMAGLLVAEVPFAQAYTFFLGAVLVVPLVARLQRRSGAVVAAIALIALVVPWAASIWHSGPGWFQALDIVITAYVTYAFLEITRTNRALFEARAEIARLASEAERNRIARDLHDLLGHSLTAITVKAGLAHRLSASDPSSSVREIGEVEDLSRQALGDVRAAVSNYRDVTLTGELARGRELLRASGVIANLPTATDVVATAHQELLGWAVREGVTNVARHARATRCTVTLAASTVEILDDGVGGQLSEGSGLAGLRERVSAAGGTVEVGPIAPRGWRLRVSLGPERRVPA